MINHIVKMEMTIAIFVLDNSNSLSPFSDSYAQSYHCLALECELPGTIVMTDT